MQTHEHFKPLKNLLHFEQQTEREIRSDLERKLTKSMMGVREAFNLK